MESQQKQQVFFNTPLTQLSFEFSKFWVELLFLWSPFSIWFNQRQRVGIQFIQQIVPHQLIHHSHSKAALLLSCGCLLILRSALLNLTWSWLVLFSWVSAGAILEIGLRVGVILLNVPSPHVVLTIFLSFYPQRVQRPLHGALSAVILIKLSFMHRIMWFEHIK